MIIAICEDNSQDRDYMHSHLSRIIKEQDIDANFVTFTSAEAMIEYAKQNGLPSISFLDVYMRGMSGIALAEWIRERSDTAAIVFTTSSPDHMASGWRVGASHYLLKPCSSEEIRQALFRCLNLIGYRKRYVEVVSNRVKRKIILDQVTYVESQDKHCFIHMADGACVQTLMRLDDIENLLADQRFLRCHRSYLVNMDKIEKATGSNFCMADATHIPIRRETRADLIARYEDYYIDKTRRKL